MSGAGLPDFSDPPVVETVLGVGFLEVPELTSVQIVRFWTRELADELPSDAQSPPYNMPIERFPLTPAREVSLTLHNEPPPSRFMFHDGNHLVQLQSDWFAYNWRKTKSRPAYERYESGRSRFVRYLSKLSRFLAEEWSTDIQPAQCEVTYVNHISLSALDKHSGTLGTLLNDIQPKAGVYLPQPRYADASWGYDVETSSIRGRLHVTARAEVGPEPGSQVVLSLTARGAPVSRNVDGILSFLDCGREWIVRGFQDITAPQMHKRWGLKRREGTQ